MPDKARPFLYLVKGLQTIAFETQCQYSSLLGRFKADQRKLHELRQLGIAPCVSTLCLSNVIAFDWISQALPLHFGILEAIKNCSQEGLGTRLIICNYALVSLPHHTVVLAGKMGLVNCRPLKNRRWLGWIIHCAWYPGAFRLLTSILMSIYWEH